MTLRRANSLLRAFSVKTTCALQDILSTATRSRPGKLYSTINNNTCSKKMRLPFLTSLLYRPPRPAHGWGYTTTTSSQRSPSSFFNISRSGSLLVVLLTLVLCAVSPAHLIDPRTTLACHVRSYQFRVTKPPVLDSKGHLRTCTGLVTVNSCWGRCDSSEIGDFVMPYRISHHPVCTYTGRVSRRVTLPDCHDYPDPTVDVFDATGCECRMCDSDYTSCENLNG